MSVLLNSLGIFVYMMKFLIKYYVRKKILNLKGSKLGQILCADKTGFADSVTYKLTQKPSYMLFSCKCWTIFVDITPPLSPLDVY